MKLHMLPTIADAAFVKQQMRDPKRMSIAAILCEQHGACMGVGCGMCPFCDRYHRRDLCGNKQLQTGWMCLSPGMNAWRMRILTILEVHS